MIEARSDLPSTALASCSGSGAGEADGFWRSVVDLLSSPFENESALRENDFALRVLENLDHNWFFDNITGISFCSPPSTSGYLLAAAGEDFVRNIEMGNRTEANIDDDLKRRNVIELPRPSLQRTPLELQDRERHLELEKREKERERVREGEVNPPKKGHQRSQSDTIGRRGSSSVGVIHYRLPQYDLSETRVRFFDSAINPTQEIPGTTLSLVKAKQHSSRIPRPPKLESIPSGKQLQEHTSLADLGAQHSRVRRRDRRRATKSMTDLEIDELQGFMDLGFKFNMNDLSPHVVNVLPGLQRLGGQKVQTSIVSRPYLSEAWLIPRSDSPLLNWRVPSEHGEAVTMKEQLKFWARAVASTMQQAS